MCSLVLVGASTGLAGGLDRVPAAPLPTVEAGEFAEGDPWRVRVTGAGLFSGGEPLRLQDDRNHWLAVSAEVEITAPESRSDLGNVLYVVGIDGLGVGAAFPGILTGVDPADDIRMVRDDSVATLLHPGLPEQLLFFWERAAGAGPPPAEIQVEIVGMTFRESTLSGRMEWLDPVPRARVLLPLQDLREVDLTDPEAGA